MEEEAAEAAAIKEGDMVKTDGAKDGQKAKKSGAKDKANLDNEATDDGADDEAPAKPNTTKKAEKSTKK